MLASLAKRGTQFVLGLCPKTNHLPFLQVKRAIVRYSLVHLWKIFKAQLRFQIAL
ncbi:MAG: hypothetical protein U5L45_17815 [Saprospiraceae bacterium]|nr:hypothetical protein [Saprospiraceae bacterium]